MKRLSALLLALLMCLSFTACKKDKDKDTKTATADTAQTECTEQQVKRLVEKNLDCYFIYYVSPLTHTTQQNSDGYYGTDGSYFSSYKELEDLVKSTYTAEKATQLLSYPSENAPLYKNVEGLIFTKPDVIKPVEYNIIWDSYTVEFTENGTKKCSFKLNTTDLDGKEYTTDGEAVFENGTWLLTDLIY